jgi:hypothetical protein
MMVKNITMLIVLSTLLAGCADVIPDLPSDEEVVINEWTTLTGNFTALIDDVNNSTYEVVNIGNASKWLVVDSFNYTATHLSFVVTNNTVIFNNYTFDNIGFLEQNGVVFNQGYAPNYGDAQLFFPVFPYDMTVEYTVVFKTVSGR